MIDDFVNQLLVGDVLEILPQIPSASVELVCTDPPYNLGKDYGKTVDKRNWDEYERFTRQWLAECRRILRDAGSIYVFMGVRFIAKLFLIMEEMGFLFNGWITWHYTQGTGRTIGFSPRHENILYFTKSVNYTFNLDEVRIPQKYYRERNNMRGANPGDVWEFSHVHYSNPEREDRPTQKPEALVERIIRASSNEFEVVLDPFVGSGTTVRVAQVLKRKYIGIDINPEYVEMARRRLKQLSQGFDSIDPRVNRQPRDLPQEHAPKRQQSALPFFR
ncbi:MAG: site-specific DNA-methyltransferase [Chloroflexota bacterium]|nr:site-specific DNA-methyltransferase [Chloroflexota bacterium]